MGQLWGCWGLWRPSRLTGSGCLSGARLASMSPSLHRGHPRGTQPRAAVSRGTLVTHEDNRGSGEHLAGLSYGTRTADGRWPLLSPFHRGEPEAQGGDRAWPLCGRAGPGGKRRFVICALFCLPEPARAWSWARSRERRRQHGHSFIHSFLCSLYKHFQRHSRGCEFECGRVCKTVRESVSIKMCLCGCVFVREGEYGCECV